MKPYLIIIAILYAIEFIGRLYFLATESYPRTRSSITRGEEVLKLLFAIGFLVWVLYLLEAL